MNNDINIEDYKSIINKMKLNNIYIDDSNKINFKDFYSNLIPQLKKPNSNEIENLEINYNNYVIKLFKNNLYFCDINLLSDNSNQKKIIERVFIKPIKIIYKLEAIEIAYLNQFNEIPKLLHIKRPILFCNKHDIKINYKIKDLINHIQDFIIYDSNQCKIELLEKSKDDDYYERKYYYTFKKNKYSNKFETPIDFDINYEDYFDFYKYQINDQNFVFFDDEKNSRELSIANLLCFNNFLGNFTIYYGQSGMGKSITLIKAFKYNYNHDSFGTLYIHCKCMHNYYFNNFQKMKKILKDEIIYLFKNEYYNYKKCLKYIDKFQNNKNFFDLVNNIIKKFCNNKLKKYIFVFDQYKAEFDPNGELNNLNKTLINNSAIYGLIACCSMDNKSVRELKIKNLSYNLFREESLDEETDNIIIEEIIKIFDISKLTIDNGEIFDKTLDKIGKTLKNYIALKEFSRNNNYDAMKNYVNDLKTRMTNNLKDFFKLNKKILEENETSNLINLYNILSFTVNTDYDIDYIKTIKNYIPFKYFDIKLNKENENISEIVFNCELVGEVMNKIYEDIIYENNNIYQIFDNIKLDRGALDGLYEKYVIHFMEPDEHIHERKLFNLFNINEIITVDKFVPNSKEKYFNHNYVIRSLKNGDYLFKQNQFGGKAFDCAIIRVNNNNAQVFFFQISIKKDTLYSINQLNKFIETFIDYFSYQFDLKIKQEDVYFSYIFHTKEKDELCKKCDKNNLKCIFFNPSIQKFTNKNYEELDDINNENKINNIFVNPFKLYNNNNNKDKDNDIDMEDLVNIKVSNNIMQPNFTLNYNQIYNIVKLWKTLFNEFNENNIEIFFSHSTRFIDEKYLSNKIMYLRKLNENEIEDWINAKIEKEIKINKKNNILLIYRERNLDFRIISDEGAILKLKYVPITSKVGIKNYDVYVVK